jgi:hypothetical protein
MRRPFRSVSDIQKGGRRSKPGDSITRKPRSTERPEPKRTLQDQQAPEPGPQEPRPETARQQPQPGIYRDVILDVRDRVRRERRESETP